MSGNIVAHSMTFPCQETIDLVISIASEATQELKNQLEKKINYIM
jgi:hypothetical protein